MTKEPRLSEKSLQSVMPAKNQEIRKIFKSLREIQVDHVLYQLDPFEPEVDTTFSTIEKTINSN